MYPSPNGTGDVRGYLVRPSDAGGRLPAVLVIHENWGLNPYIEDVARRLAKTGFMALAPDGLTSVGGYPGNDMDGRELQRTVDRTELMKDFSTGFENLLNRDYSTGKVGAVGFCYGGGVVGAISAAYLEVAAGVPFYGRQPASTEVPKVHAPLLVQMGELDERINAGGQNPKPLRRRMTRPMRPTSTKGPITVSTMKARLDTTKCKLR